ncbi:MAG TPA: dTMP kinase [Candidatus Angelobacter sp.]|nr:dTMP kinase [Candidatus Angelobacter sp.]
MPSKPHGKFITFEGLDGSGKSTQLKKLASYLRSQGLDVVITREPGGTSLGSRLRAVLLNSRTSGLSSMAELALMFADRAQDIDEKILPALQRGQWVLCDRFSDSSEAYQGGGRRLGSEAVHDLHRILCHDLKPDLTILMLFDLSASIARARRRNTAKSKKKDENRFEKEKEAFHQRVMDTYLAIAKREPQRIVKINAQEPISVVHRKIVQSVEERLMKGSGS